MSVTDITRSNQEGLNPTEIASAINECAKERPTQFEWLLNEYRKLLKLYYDDYCIINIELKINSENSRIILYHTTAVKTARSLLY